MLGYDLDRYNDELPYWGGTDLPTPWVGGAVGMQTSLFRTNWELRHDCDPYWRRLHRHKARQAVGELRYLTNRPRKGQAPWQYGHGAA